jgi:hypothetical protein
MRHHGRLIVVVTAWALALISLAAFVDLLWQ